MYKWAIFVVAALLLALLINHLFRLSMVPFGATWTPPTTPVKSTPAPALIPRPLTTEDQHGGGGLPLTTQSFKTEDRFDQMTPLEYHGWLMRHCDHLNRLAPRHLHALQKILQGRQLSEEDVPRDTLPLPITAQEYYQRMIGFDDQMVPQNVITAGLPLPANYPEDGVFEMPTTLKHLSFQEPLPSLVKEGNKDVLLYTRPQISRPLEESLGNQDR
jgi:hypothetical protein